MEIPGLPNNTTGNLKQKKIIKRLSIALSKDCSIMVDEFLILCTNEPLLQPEGQVVSVNLSRNVRKPAFCICENKDADQLRGHREADQRLCFRNIDSTIPLLPKYEISSL